MPIHQVHLAEERLHRQSIISGPVLFTLMRLSLPNMIAMSATAIVAIAETVYVGYFGIFALAGMAVVFPCMMLQHMVSAGSFGGAIVSVLSKELGRGDITQAGHLAVHALAINFVVSLLVTILFLSMGEQIFVSLGARGEVIEEALRYSNVFFSGVVAIWIFNAAAAIIRATGNMQFPSAVSVFVAIVQVCLGATFAFGLGPFPKLGIAGIAFGQITAFALGMALLLYYLFTGKAGINLRLKSFNSQFAPAREILKIGSIAAISPLQSVLAVMVTTRIFASLGFDALAGFGIAVRMEFLLIPFAFAIGVASLPMVGMSLGAGLNERARSVAWTACRVSALLFGMVAITLAIFPEYWTRIFTSEEKVINVVAKYFLVMWVSLPFFGAGLSLFLSSQGAGKVAGPVLANTLRLLIVAIGAWWILSINATLTDALFIVSVSFMAYGIATVSSVYFKQW